MSNDKCPYCKDFNDEKYQINICEVEVQGGYYHYYCPINYCPNCGKILKRFKKDDKAELYS